MSIKTEESSDEPKILIVDEGTRLASLLRAQLTKHNNDVFVSPRAPENLHTFTWVFLIHQKLSEVKKLTAQTDQSLKNCVLIFFDHKKQTEQLSVQLKNTHKDLKIILIDDPHDIDINDLEKIFWFSFSKSHENFLHLRNERNTEKKEITRTHFYLKLPHIRLKPKMIPILILSLLLILHLLFIPPLIFASLNIYKGAHAIIDRDGTKTVLYTNNAQKLNHISKVLYALARPTLSLFSLSSATDNLFQINETAVSILQESQNLYQKTQSIMTLIFKKQKTAEEIEAIRGQKKLLSNQIDLLEPKIEFLQEKLPQIRTLNPIRSSLQKTLDAIQVIQKFIPYFDSIFAKDGKKTYLLLFANNMELRPGGGFIGSYGLVNVANYTIDDIKIYDVYDADGQLTEHIDPPEPIRNFLQQPNWYLRDSAFSPDFLTNFNQAKIFLQKEIGLSEVDGAALITTTTIQNLLGAVGELYVPDYNEKVNKDNFYLKAQLYAEKDFFPGSIQKKQFLGSVTDQLLIQLENSVSPTALQAFKKSLDEKQIVLQMNDAALQRTIDSYYWSGRVIEPACTSADLSENCITDYLLPYDANLGVNKANFFVKRSQKMKVMLKSDGSVEDEYTLILRNEATSDVFPGGTYRNYLQIALPKGADIASVTKNNSLVEHMDVNEQTYKTIGLYVEVPPRKQAVITVSYHLPQKFQTGKGQYQLIVQKQIGSANSDLQIDLEMPGTYHISRKNYAGVVKDGAIVYNTSLSADKIFLVELIKE